MDDAEYITELLVEHLYKDKNSKHNEGKIFSIRSERYLVSNPNKRFGYCFVRLVNKWGNVSPMGVHSVILSAYLGYPKEVWLEEGLNVHHLDGDNNNNSALNPSVS